MGRKATDRGATLREAIQLLLDDADRPLTSAELAANPLVKDMGFTGNDVSMILVKMLTLAKPPFPLKRVRVTGQGAARWGWYNPEKNPQLEDRPRKPEPASTEAFTFDPLPEALVPPAPPSPPAESTVVLPTSVRAITLEVGGVKLHIQLDALAAAR